MQFFPKQEIEESSAITASTKKRSEGENGDYLLFGCVNDSALLNFGDNGFVRALLSLVFQAFQRGVFLRVAVIENDGRILPLDSSRQPVLVIIPEQVEQLGVADFLRIVVDRDHLDVVASATIREK